MSKFVLVEFSDATDISSLPEGNAADTTVTVTKTTAISGNVVIKATRQNPPVTTLVPHIHTVDAPPVVTGPAVPE